VVEKVSADVAERLVHVSSAGRWKRRTLGGQDGVTEFARAKGHPQRLVDLVSLNAEPADGRGQSGAGDEEEGVNAGEVVAEEVIESDSQHKRRERDVARLPKILEHTNGLRRVSNHDWRVRMHSDMTVRICDAKNLLGVLKSQIGEAKIPVFRDSHSPHQNLNVTRTRNVEGVGQPCNAANYHQTIKCQLNEFPSTREFVFRTNKFIFKLTLKNYL